MSRASNSNFTRGAQLWAHNIRMILQGLRNVCIFGLVVALGVLTVRIGQHMTFATFYYFLIERYVQFKLAVGAFFYGKGKIGITFYSLDQGKFVFKNAQDFIHKFWHVTEHGLVIRRFLLWVVAHALTEVLLAFVIGSTVSLLYFSYRGRNIIGTMKLRGSELVSVPQLRRLLKRARQASKIQIAGLPIVKDSETQHILLTGTTGTGKTNMLNELLPQIRLRQNRAIIFDVTGEFVDRFFNPATDIILNPLRDNSVDWLPWNDCHTDEEYNNLAAAFVDGESITSDRYWEDAARKVLSEAFKKEKDNRSIESLLDVIGKIPLHEFSEYFADTFAAAFVSKEAEKGTASVRATLLNKIERLKHLKDGGQFSIKNWVNGGTGWLFINSKPNELDTLRPLISAWANIAINGMLDRPHSGKNEKMWFVMDELPAIQKIPSLAMVLAQGRKYGACLVAGIQNIAQLDRIYGHDGSKELLDLFRTRFFFAVSDNHIAEYASKSLGEIEIDETKESLSYGSNTMRDGVNINSAEKIKRLVLPDEVKNLPPLTCYVKLCGEYPITKLKMELQVQGSVPMGSYKLFNYFVKNKQEGKVLEIQHETVVATSSANDNTYQHKIHNIEDKGISPRNSKISMAKREIQEKLESVAAETPINNPSELTKKDLIAKLKD
jgi:type IV conjugative transfer system coupling protein TraD